MPIASRDQTDQHQAANRHKANNGRGTNLRFDPFQVNAIGSRREWKRDEAQD